MAWTKGVEMVMMVAVKGDHIGMYFEGRAN